MPHTLNESAVEGFYRIRRRCFSREPSDLREAQVNRAIELTKSRQMNTPVGKTSARSTQNTSGRSEAIDVSKLNLLIRALDKTWVFPRLGSKDPIGSNFQLNASLTVTEHSKAGIDKFVAFTRMTNLRKSTHILYQFAWTAASKH
ncbi:hypothetical protein KIN20_003544 [Parelaphostrongylus tenuis]|uniref:Uncharacterized protein n=1 Tax=Parelaphostrongylus tenuis TaxID=148309 RepID=A0AAD5QHG1_PARTN|nr:hypothetical protein KIN20_003544 [Parelaphostrongylus tenuis]